MKKIFWKKLLCAMLMTACMCQYLAACDMQGSVATEASANSTASSTEGTAAVPEKDYWHDDTHWGLAVSDGVLTLAGKTYYGAGVNCYNLFNQCFTSMSADKAKQALDILKQYDVKVIRFNCGGYSYRDFTQYEANREQYLAVLRQIADYAAQLEIGLIPSLFWLSYAVPDYVDEPIRAWGQEGSKTIAFMRQYTEDVVSALYDCKSIFAWEFGNEFNLSCDLPNAAEHMPPLPADSSRTERTAADYLSAADVQYAMESFVEVITAIDTSGRMITSGNASLRTSQYNQLKYGTWIQDSRSQYTAITAVFHPDGVDCVSEHTYFTSQNTFGQMLTLCEYLKEAIAVAKSLNKAYYVGEWGGGGQDGEACADLAQQIMDAGVQLSLIWNYNLTEDAVEHSFTADSQRGQALLELIGQMNSKYNRMNTDE